MGANHTKGRGGLGRVVLLAGLLVGLGSTDVLAQQWHWPEKTENLQVLPEDIGPDELSATMRGFAMALGVRCEHCHDDTNGNRLSEIDFPADTKETKEIARLMLKMVHRINSEELAELDEDRPERVQVTCVTCHRLLEQEKPDDAVAFLHLNLEMYPESWQTHVAFGQFYMQQEDNEQAIASLEKAYELSPAPWIQQQLERLKSQ